MWLVFHADSESAVFLHAPDFNSCLFAVVNAADGS